MRLIADLARYYATPIPFFLSLPPAELLDWIALAAQIAEEDKANGD